jgi:glycosyltransferase involved in cell wall biosynthesis
MADPLVSIVVPAFVTSPRQMRLLDETLATVDSQTRPDFEVIIVNDGSPLDPSADAARHRQVRVIRQANGGSAVARNTGIAASRGRFLLFLDADDHLMPGSLETGLRALEARPDAGFAVGPREEMTYEGAPVPWPVPPPPDQTQIYEPLLAFEWYIIPPSSVLFRREVVQAIGGFRNPWGADDLDFYLRAAWSFRACCYSSPPVTRYRRYSTSSSRDGERMLQSIRTVYDRQRLLVRGNQGLERAFETGLTKLTRIFEDCVVENLVDRIAARQWRRAARSALVLARERPERLLEVATRLARRRPVPS